MRPRNQQAWGLCSNFSRKEMVMMSMVKTPTTSLPRHSLEVRKVINYDYNNGFIHVIQMLGCSADKTDGSIEYLSGQGHTTQRT